MLWSQYKLATIRCTEFLRKEITGILNIANRNSNILTLQTSEFQKEIRPESLESNTESEFRLQWGSQKSEPKIGIPNQGNDVFPLMLTWWNVPIPSTNVSEIVSGCEVLPGRHISIVNCILTVPRSLSTSPWKDC